MSNVLTLEEKKKLSRRLIARFVAAGSVMLICGAFIASLSLAPAFLAVTVARASLGASSTETSEGTREEGAEATRAQALLDELGPLLRTQPTPSENLAQALALAPAGISVTAIGYRDGAIELSGASSGREAVNEFRLVLQEADLFSRVEVPVTALVSGQAGRFTMTLIHDE